MQKKVLLVHFSKGEPHGFEATFWKTVAQKSLPIPEMKVLSYQSKENFLRQIEKMPLESFDMLIILGSSSSIPLYYPRISEVIESTNHFVFTERLEEIEEEEQKERFIEFLEEYSY
jgi:hypothetical protein